MTRWLGTILTRIFWLHLATFTAAALIMSVTIHLLLNTTLATFERNTLKQHAAAIAAAIHSDGQGLRMSLPSGLRQLYAGGYGGYAFAVIDPAGRPLFSSLQGGAALFANDPRDDSANFFQRPHGVDAFYGASIPQKLGGRRVWVQVRQNLDDPDVFVDDVVSQFLGHVGWLIAPIVLLLLAVDIVIVRRALAPVREASRHAESIDPTRIDVRLPTHALPSEIVPLVAATNRALDRLEAGFRVQREFTADAAHELRTPLAVIRLRADTIADQETAALLRTDIDAMSRLVDQLLAMAELETFALASTDQADLREIGMDAVSLMAPLAIAAGRQLELKVGEAQVLVQGRPEALLRAVRNLIENAIVHSPLGGSITVSIDADGVVVVDDEGPGIPDQDRELVFQRFWRRDRQSAGGSGLGLSIVNRIVEAHAGAIDIGAAPSGGARFTMRFNRA